MNEYCCNSFTKIAKGISWMQFVDENKETILCMPYIKSGEIKYRINYCPSCGKEIRSIEIKLSKYLNF